MRDLPNADQTAQTLDPIDLVLKVSSSVAHRLYDDFDISDISHGDDGFHILKVKVPETEWIYGYILSFGSEAEIIEPEHMKRRIYETASDILKKYSDKTCSAVVMLAMLY